MTTEPQPARYVRKLYGSIVMACMSVIEREFPGARAYLVGSALTATTRPRDVDVRIVLTDDAFQERFGFGREEWAAVRVEWPRSAAFRAYMRLRDDVEKFIAYACGERTMDVSIVPRSIFDVHKNDPKEVLVGPRGDNDD